MIGRIEKRGNNVVRKKTQLSSDMVKGEESE